MKQNSVALSIEDMDFYFKILYITINYHVKAPVVSGGTNANTEAHLASLLTSF